jgi:hypothetical protein
VLVIAVNTAAATPDRLPWTGRRHDDEGTESTGVQTPEGLFEAVFYALHDGEQVAVGFDCALTAPDAESARELESGPGMAAVRHLVTELGTWRPWTIVTTSLARWRATTSVLVWEAVADGAVEPGAAIEAFFATLRTAREADEPGPPCINLAATVAVTSGASADASDVTRHALRVRVPVQV